MKAVKNFLLMTVGAALAGVGIGLILVPNQLVTGGISAIATIVNYMTSGRVPVGMLVWLINIPLLVVGFFTLGKRMILKSLWGITVMSVMIEVASWFQMPIHDRLIAAVFGGLMVGAGLGTVFISGSTTGGVDIVARLLQRAIKWFPIGKIILMLDAIVIAIAIYVFRNLEAGLYSVIALYVSTYTIDAILDGVDLAKMLFIISEKEEEISSAIQTRMIRGVTGLSGQGMYSRSDKIVLICTVRRQEVPKIKEIVKEIDPNAFVILSDVREVLGRGFNPIT